MAVPGDSSGILVDTEKPFKQTMRSYVSLASKDGQIILVVAE